VTSGRHNFAMITDRRKFTTKWSVYWMSAFHFFPLKLIKIFPLWCTRRTRKVPTQSFGNVPRLILGKLRTPLCCLADGHGRKADWTGNWK